MYIHTLLTLSLLSVYVLIGTDNLHARDSKRRDDYTAQRKQKMHRKPARKEPPQPQYHPSGPPVYDRRPIILPHGVRMRKTFYPPQPRFRAH